MRKIFGAMAVAAALLMASAVQAQDEGTQDQGTQVDPGDDQGYNPEPGADERTANPEDDTGAQEPITPEPPAEGDQAPGQCQCPCPQEQQGM